MSQIQTGRYSDMLRRFLGMKGVTAVAGELSPEISPVFILEDARPEWLFLKGEKLVSSVYAFTPGAGLLAGYRLVNPALSGVMATIDYIDVVLTTDENTMLVERNTEQGNLATVLPTVARDTRLPILNASALIASQGDAVLSGQSFLATNLNAADPWQIPVSFVLTPGHQIQITCLGPNVSIRGSVQWRERRIDVLEQSSD